MLEHPDRKKRDLTSLRTGILAAGMHSTEPIARRAQEMLRTMTGYGMTEIGVGVTGSFLDSDVESCTTMSGWPLVGYEIKIIDPLTGATLPPGEIGEICVRGYQVMQGYYKKPEETAKTIDPEGWLHTGDTGFMRADGCMRFLGRFKDMLKVGGENVSPAEVETYLRTMPEVLDAAVVAYPDPRLAEVPVAFVILKPGENVPGESLTARLKGRIASYKIPRHVIVVDEFPMTPSGKIRKVELRARAKECLHG
jgi:fatty-acyl-CoA synthase